MRGAVKVRITLGASAAVAGACMLFLSDLAAACLGLAWLVLAVSLLLAFPD